MEKKLSEDEIIAVSNLAETQVTLLVMISKDGSDAYRLYRENIKAVKSGLHTLEQKLDLVTQTSIPLNKNDWTKTKENVVYSFEELYEKTNDELASKYGDGAATLYKYS